MRKTEGEQSAMVFISVLRACFRLWAWTAGAELGTLKKSCMAREHLPCCPLALVEEATQWDAPYQSGEHSYPSKPDGATVSSLAFLECCVGSH